MSRITLWGFYQYTDRTLFNNIKLYNKFDKTILVDLIMQQSGELFPFHQHPDYLKRNIENWFVRMYDEFKRMYDTLYSDYNPIENYDRIENWSDSESTSISESESTSSSGSAHDSTSDSTSNHADNQISAANMTTGFVPDTAANGQTAGVSSADTRNQTATRKVNSHDRLNFSKHGGRVHGNIGVTTTQQMIEQELELRKYDIYLTIANMFESEFIVRVY